MISPVFARIRKNRPEGVRTTAIILTVIAIIAFGVATCIPTHAHAWSWWNKTFRDRNK